MRLPLPEGARLSRLALSDSRVEMAVAEQIRETHLVVEVAARGRTVREEMVQLVLAQWVAVAVAAMVAIAHQDKRAVPVPTVEEEVMEEIQAVVFKAELAITVVVELVEPMMGKGASTTPRALEPVAEAAKLREELVE